MNVGLRSQPLLKRMLRSYGSISQKKILMRLTPSYCILKSRLEDSKSFPCVVHFYLRTNSLELTIVIFYTANIASSSRSPVSG